MKDEPFALLRVAGLGTESDLVPSWNEADENIHAAPPRNSSRAQWFLVKKSGHKPRTKP